MAVAKLGAQFVNENLGKFTDVIPCAFELLGRLEENGFGLGVGFLVEGYANPDLPLASE
jgi:hypothetical protein